MCSSDPRSLRCAQAEANAAGDAHVAIELTVDGDLAKRGAKLDVEDPRGRSTRDESRLVVTDECWALEIVMLGKRQKHKIPNKSGQPGLDSAQCGFVQGVHCVLGAYFFQALVVSILYTGLEGLRLRPLITDTIGAKR